MNSDELSKNRQKLLATIVILALIAGFILLKSYFSIIALAVLLAFLFNPVYEWGLKKFKNKQGRAITLTVLALFASVAIPVAIILTITVYQALEILDIVKAASATAGSYQEAISSVINSLNTQLDKIPGLNEININKDEVTAWVKDVVETVLSASISFISSFAGGIAGFFTNLIIFLFIFSSLLKNQKSIVNTLYDLNPLGKESTQLYLSKMGAMTSAMVKGQFTIALMQGLSGILSLWIIGFDYLAFWFVLLTFLSIIPLGGGIILIPLGIVLILLGDIWQGVFLLCWHFLITTNIDNIFRPKFVPKSARLDPALTILSVFAGVSIFGFLGIVIGPVIMIVIQTTIEVYLSYKRYGKGLENIKENKKGVFGNLFKKFKVFKTN